MAYKLKRKSYFSFEYREYEDGTPYIRVLETWPADWWGGSYVGEVQFNEKDNKWVFYGNGAHAHYYNGEWHFAVHELNFPEIKGKSMKEFCIIMNNRRSNPAYRGFYKLFY